MILTKVDFPEPLSPLIPIKSNLFIEKFKLSKILFFLEKENVYLEV